ncbi:MAG: hypothetical protein HQK52_19450 [Oligoflexia bacterium]|nr:hypothetical protein [Oligoflexia bacterium]
MDIEDFLDKLENCLKENINKTIDEINALKNDSIKLEHISSNAYMLQSVSDKVLNYSPTLYLGVDSISNEASGRGLAETYTIEVTILMNGVKGRLIDEKVIPKKMYRYERVLKDTIRRSWRSISNQEMKIQSFAPTSFNLENSNPCHVVGIKLETTIFNN